LGAGANFPDSRRTAAGLASAKGSDGADSEHATPEWLTVQHSDQLNASSSASSLDNPQFDSDSARGLLFEQQRRQRRGAYA